MLEDKMCVVQGSSVPCISTEAPTCLPAPARAYGWSSRQPLAALNRQATEASKLGEHLHPDLERRVYWQGSRSEASRANYIGLNPCILSTLVKQPHSNTPPQDNSQGFDRLIVGLSSSQVVLRVYIPNGPPNPPNPSSHFQGNTVR